MMSQKVMKTTSKLARPTGLPQSRHSPIEGQSPGRGSPIAQHADKAQGKFMCTTISLLPVLGV